MVTIYVSKDAYGEDYYFPNNNYGSQTYVRAGHVSGEYSSYAAYLEFDLSSIPAGATIDSATLNLYINQVDGASANNVKRMTSQFTEGSVTWNNSPATTDTNATTMSNTTGWKSVTITGMVQDALSSRYIGIKILGGSYCVFYTKEYDGGSTKAYLTITYSLQTDVYVNSSTGNDSNVGDSCVAGHPVQTFAKAYELVASGGTIHVCNDGADFSGETVSLTKPFSIDRNGSSGYFYMPAS